MAPEAVALLASVSFALFAIYGWLGLRVSTPLFSLVISLIFFRGKEQITDKTIIGTIAVVAGTIAIALGK